MTQEHQKPGKKFESGGQWATKEGDNKDTVKVQDGVGGQGFPRAIGLL